MITRKTFLFATVLIAAMTHTDIHANSQVFPPCPPYEPAVAGMGARFSWHNRKHTDMMILFPATIGCWFVRFVVVILSKFL